MSVLKKKAKKSVLGQAGVIQNVVSEILAIAYAGQSLAVGMFNSQEDGSSIGIDTFNSTMLSLNGLSVAPFDAAEGGTYLTSYSDTRNNANAWWDGVNQQLANIGVAEVATMDAQAPLGGIAWRQGQADQNKIEADLSYDLWNEQVGSGIVVVNYDNTFNMTDDDTNASEYIREVVTVEAGRVPAFNFYLKKDTSATGSPFFQITHGSTTNAAAVDPTNGNTRVTSGNESALSVTEVTDPVVFGVTLSGTYYHVILTSESAVTSADYTVDFRFYPARGNTGGSNIGLGDTNTGTITVADASNYQNYAGSFSNRTDGKVSYSQWLNDCEALLQYLANRYRCKVMVANLGHRDGTESSLSDIGQNFIQKAYNVIFSRNSNIVRGEELYPATLTDTVHPDNAGYAITSPPAARAGDVHFYGGSSNYIGVTGGEPSVSGDSIIIPTNRETGTSYGTQLTRVAGVADLSPASGKTAFVQVYKDGSPLTPVTQSHYDNSAALNPDSYVLTFASGELGNDSNQLSVYFGYGAMYNLDESKLLFDSNGLPTRQGKWVKEAGGSSWAKEYGA